MAWPPIAETLVSAVFPWNFGYSYFKVSNTQGAATPANFQQLIQLPSYLSLSSYPLRFFSDPALTQPLYAWYETLTDVWVLLPSGVGGGSSVNIYAAPAPLDGVYTGVAPYLTSTYGALDNGFTVFPALYDNFAGTSLRPLWAPTGIGQPMGTYQVNNGFTSTCTTGEAVALDTAAQTYSLAGVYFESCIGPVAGSAASNNIDAFQVANGVATHGSNTDSVLFGVAGTVQLYYTDSAGNNNADGSASITLNQPHNIIGVSANGSTVAGYVDYNMFASTPETYVPTNIYFNAFLNYLSGSTSPTVYWARIRAYPPNGVMPTVQQQ